MTSVFLVAGILGFGMILFALRPGPWVFNITEESLRTPPSGGRLWREWWSEAELEEPTTPWAEHATELVDRAIGVAATIGALAERRPAIPGRT
ncbi:MAG TPA: hypothetical protein VFQ71_11615, partial [Gaiellales bacterium]|nr:hypothetical protein [Gaiellales bacterium]